MSRTGRRLKIVGIVLLALLLVAAAIVYAGSQRILGRRYQATLVQLPAPAPALVADAARQAKLLGCVSCHGPTLQGQLVGDIPLVAHIEAPDLQAIVHGLTDQQLAQAIRQGIAPDGRGLWVMPALSRISEAELSALIAWLRQLPQTNGAKRSVSFGPLGRLAILAGKLKPMAATIGGPEDHAPRELGPEHERGRHIAATVCAECHGFTLHGEKMEDGSVSPDLAIAAAYTPEQFRTLLRTGKGLGDRELGLMSENARLAFSAFNDAEIEALYGYLKARAAAP